MTVARPSWTRSSTAPAKGPCLEALSTGQIVDVPDQAADHRWEPYGRRCRRSRREVLARACRSSSGARRSAHSTSTASGHRAASARRSDIEPRSSSHAGINCAHAGTALQRPAGARPAASRGPARALRHRPGSRRSSWSSSGATPRRPSTCCVDASQSANQQAAAHRCRARGARQRTPGRGPRSVRGSGPPRSPLNARDAASQAGALWAYGEQRLGGQPAAMRAAFGPDQGTHR